MKRNINAHFLGRVPYRKAHALQEELVQKRIAGEIGDTILLLEHPAVITLGRGADRANIVAAQNALEELGVEVVETGRGGDVTYHAPGQLVAYPILDLKPDRCDVRKYVRDLCEVMIRLAADFDIGAGMIPNDSKKIGVWVDLEGAKNFDLEKSASAQFGKIGAVGVRLSRWVTMHGFAFNASVDLRGFSLIVPCGIREHGVTSLAALGVAAPSIEALAEKSLIHFANVFDARVSWTSALSSESLREFSPPG